MQSLWKDLQPKGGAADTHGATYRGETSYVLALSCFFLPKRKPSFTCSASSLSGNTPALLVMWSSDCLCMCVWVESIYNQLSFKLTIK